MRNELNIEMGNIRKCSHCGKTFIPTPQWIYRNIQTTKWYCSYTCFRTDSIHHTKFKNNVK